MVVFEKGLSVSMNAKIIGTSREEVVVLGHGYGGDHTIWDKIAPSLAEKYGVVVFDWKFSGAARGAHGKQQNKEEAEAEAEAAFEYHVKRSRNIDGFAGDDLKDPFDPIKYSTYDAFAADLVDLMDEMGLGSSSPVFVGHSMSGMIGCIASIKRPHLFRKLILICASPRYLNSEGYEGGLEREEVDQLLAAIESNFHSWASAFAPLAVGGKDAESASKFENTLRSMTPEAAQSLAKTIFLGDWRDILEEVETPCTIIQTTNDVVVPNSVGYYMQEKMAKGKTKVECIDTDGHFPQLTAHHQLLQVLERALAQEKKNII